jgi:ankyrin repeat protein
VRPQSLPIVLCFILVLTGSSRFVLVELFLDSLRGERSIGDLEDALTALMNSTDKVSTVYERTLVRIGGQNPKDCELAHRTLSWIVESKRPLTRQELQHALAVKPRSLSFQREYIFDNLEEVVALCAGLVVINQRSNTVQLMHHTTRKYFENYKNHPGWLRAAHGMIASVCLTYVSFSVFGSGPCRDDEELENRLFQYPLLRYAAEHWGNHARDDQDQTPEVKELALNFLEDKARVNSSNQVMSPSEQRYPGHSQRFIRDVNGLQTAASFGLTSIMQSLIENGADTQAKDEEGRTALHRGAENGHSAVVPILLKQGADVDVKERKYGQTALHLAALNGHKEFAQSLLEGGAHPNVKDDDEWTAIHVAAWTGKEEVVRVLLEKANVNETGKDELTALHCAAAQGHEAVARLLIDKNADVNAKDWGGWTPLHWASKKRHDVMNPRMLTIKDQPSKLLRQIVSQQKELKMVVQQQTMAVQDKVTALKGQLANLHGKLGWLPPVIGLDIDGKYHDVLTTLNLVSDAQYLRLALPTTSEKRTERPPGPARLIFAIQDELTALHCVTECGHEGVARLLLKGRAEIKEKCRAKLETDFIDVGPTALHLAAFSDHEAMVRMLLNRGADVHARCETNLLHGLTGPLHTELSSLHFAILSGNEKVVQLLIERGADAHAICLFGVKSRHFELSSLHLAVICGDVKVVQLLLSNRVDINARCEMNFDIEDRDVKQSPNILTDLTPLHLAVLLERLDITQLLLENHADVQMQFNLNISAIRLQLTTLHVALVRNQKKTVHLLLQHGADVYTTLRACKDKKIRAEMTVLHLTAPFQDMEIVRLLLEKGADVHATCQIDADGWESVQQTAEAETMEKAERKDENKVVSEQEPGLEAALSAQIFPDLSAEELFAEFFNPRGRDFAGSPVGGKTAGAYEKHRDDFYTVHAELKMVHLAAMFSNDEMVKVLLENDADPNAQPVITIGKAYADITVTLLHLAVVCGNERMVQLLLDAGADIYANLYINLGSWLHVEATVLQLAVLFGDEEIVQVILEKGADNLHLECQVTVGWTQIKLTALHLAVLLQHERKTLLLLEHGASVEEQFLLDVKDNRVQLRAIHFAAATGSPGVIQLLLDNGSDAGDVCQINNDPDNKMTPLHFAAMFNNMEAILLLIKNQADVSINCRVKLDPWLDIHLSTLHLVALWGNMDIVEPLLKGGSDAHLKGNIRCTKANAEIADLTVLHIVAMWGHQRGMEQLLEAQCDIDVKVRIIIDPLLHTELSALHIAALWNHDGTVRILLEKGPDIRSNIQIKGPNDTHLELTALHLAGVWDNEMTVQALLDSGADPNSRCEINTEESNISVNSLHLAGLWNNEVIVQALLDCGADPDSRCQINTNKFNASINTLHLAGAWNSEIIVQTLLDHGADADSWCQMNTAGSSVSINTLHLAAAWRNKSMMRLLLSTAPLNEPSVSLSGSPGRSSSGPSSSSFIHPRLKGRSRQRSHKISGDKSIEKSNERTSKADANAIFMLNLGNTIIELAAIHLAALTGSTQMIQLLCDNGADVNVIFEANSKHKHFETTPLHLAVLWQSQAMTKYLLEKEADIHAKLRVVGNNIHAEFSTLHLVVLCMNSPGVPALLLENHLDLEEKCHIGVHGKTQIELTLLHLAACVGQESIVGLLKKGVDPHTKCLANVKVCIPCELTALDLATLFDNELLSLLLLDAGAKAQPITHAKQLARLFVAVLGYDNKFTGPSLGLIGDLDEKFSLSIEAKIETAFAIPLQANADATFDINIEAEMCVLHIAAALGLVEVVSFLIQKGASLEAKCRVKVGDAIYAEFTTLHLASMLKHDKVVYLLIGKGSDVQATSQMTIQRTVQAGLIAPYLTTLSGQEGFLQFLKKGTDIEANVKAQLTSLHLAALLNDGVVAYLILSEGTDVDATCIVNVEAKTQGNSKTNIEARLTALHIAVGAGHERMVQLLIEKGADVDLAVQVSGTAVVDRGAQIHRKIRAGGTALHMAAGMGNENIARMLIDNGADVNAKSQDGRTALKWARIHGHDKVAQLILERRAQSKEESASGEKGRFRQKLHKVFSKDGSTACIGREEKSQDNGDDIGTPEVNQNLGGNVTPFLKRFVVQKAEEHLQKMRRGLFSKLTPTNSVKTGDDLSATQNTDAESVTQQTDNENSAVD